jgi:hypothetical protein
MWYKKYIFQLIYNSISKPTREPNQILLLNKELFMKKTIIVLLLICLLFTGCSNQEVSTTADGAEQENVDKKEVKEEIATTPTAGAQESKEPDVEVYIPNWIGILMREQVDAIITLGDRIIPVNILENGNRKTYVLDAESYKSLKESTKFDTLEQVIQIHPEIYNNVSVLKVDSDKIYIEVEESNFFTNGQLDYAQYLAYNHLVYQCIMGEESEEVSVELQILDKEINKVTNYYFPMKLKSNLSSEDDNEITIPSYFVDKFGGADLYATMLYAFLELEATVNSDDSVTFIASKKDAESIADGYYSQVISMLDTGKESYNFIISADLDKWKTSIYMIVDNKNVDNNELTNYLRELEFCIQAAQLHEGVPLEDINYRILIYSEAQSPVAVLFYPPYND